MKNKIFLLILLSIWIHLNVVSSLAVEKKSPLQMEYLLEKPTWGMIEWNSATLPKDFWYVTFELTYLNNGSYFETGKELDYPGGRDSTSYMIDGKFLYGLSHRLTLGVNIPVVMDQKVDSGLYGKITKVKSGASNVGDVQLLLKYHIFDRYFWSLSTELGPTLPTGQPYNEVSAKKAGTGDGQTDLNFALKGDILLYEDSFIKLGMGYTHQFKREYRNKTQIIVSQDTIPPGEIIDERLGDILSTEVGFVKNFKSFGMEGALQYNWWQAVKQNDLVVREQADLYNVSLRVSLGDVTPRKHGKLDFYLDFPLTGKNAPLTYRLGVSLKSIFR